jgi:hypothetical protein
MSDALPGSGHSLLPLSVATLELRPSGMAARQMAAVIAAVKLLNGLVISILMRLDTGRQSHCIDIME